METVAELLYAVRARFPAISARADELHIRTFEEVTPSTAYSWFESLAHVSLHCLRFHFAHVTRGPLVMEEDVVFDPFGIVLLGSQAVMLDLDTLPNLVQQAGRGGSRHQKGGRHHDAILR